MKYLLYSDPRPSLKEAIRIKISPAACQASLSFTVSWSLLKLMSTELVMPSNHLILCLLFLLPSIFLSIRVFSKELAVHIMWSKYWSFSFSITPSNEYSGLISFRTNWLDLLAVQGALKSLLQHHIVQKHQFFGTQLSSQSNSHIHTSDQISHSVVSDFLQPHESQHARPPCPSPTPRAH